MVNSRDKGKRGELEVVRILKDHGFDARRSAQYCGNTGEAADITTNTNFHLEVKFRETTAIWDWIHQARDDHKAGTIPAVVFRKSRERWQITLDFEEFLEIIKVKED